MKINGTRILTHPLYLRISCLLEGELENVQGQSIVKLSWLSSSMFWSPNIGNLFPFIVSLTLGIRLLPQQDDHSEFCGRILLSISDLLNFYFYLGGQRWREETLLELLFWYLQMASTLIFLRAIKGQLSWNGHYMMKFDSIYIRGKKKKEDILISCKIIGCSILK